MIIRKIKLRNIKSYYGEHILDLPRPNASRQLHLLGARNGVGKTTLFEAINAGFLASKSDPILRANYLSRGVDAHEMEVEIEFEHESQTYLLSRRWIRNPGHPETRVASVNLNSLLRNIDTSDVSTDEDEITLFINDLLPHQISNFFLFDGEQIQEFTDKSADSVRDALERLLGLHPYIQLLEDLRSNIEPDLRRDRDALNIKDDLYQKLAEQQSVESKLKNADLFISRNRDAAKKTKRELEELARQETGIDSIFDEQSQAGRRELEERSTALKEDIEAKENDLKALISKDLVVALFWPQIQNAYKEMADSTESDNINRASQPEELLHFLWERRNEIVSALNEESPATLHSILLPAIKSDIEQDLYHEGVEVLARMVEVSKSRLWSTLDSIKDSNAQLNQTQYELFSLPTPDSINVDVHALHQEMQELRTALSRYESSLTDYSDDKNRLQQEANTLNSAIRELSERNSKFQHIEAQLNLCRKVQTLLERFISDYRSTQIEELEHVFNRKFRELTNSPEWLSRVEIDRDTFEITPVSREDTKLAASEGSAGQKEVLAFALIASIVELSNKQLPIVIDTPLARLDEIHRRNILMGFFPSVGEQVLVLATDAEVGLEQYRRLTPYLASEHHLIRDAAGRTSIEEGYLVQ